MKMAKGTAKTKKIKSIPETGRPQFKAAAQTKGMPSDNIVIAKAMKGARSSLKERHGVSFKKK